MSSSPWRNSVFSTSLCVAVVGLLLFLFQKTTAVDLGEHYSFLNTLQQLQKLDAHLNENILKSRHTYLTNFDPLIANLRDLESISNQLDTIPTFISSKERATLAQMNGEFRQLLQQKEELTERFKGENAILRNSLSFFPIAATELANRVDPQQPALAANLRVLLQEILVYNLHSIEEVIPRLKARIATVSGAAGTLDESSKEDLSRVIRHAETILSFKRQLDDATSSLLALPTQTKLQAIYSDYHGRYQQASVTANNYRLALYMAAILLFSGIAYVFIKLKNTTTALHQANAGLEQRVSERTRELQQANRELSAQKEQLKSYIDEIHQAKEELQRIAITDELTGLFTRRFLFEWMEKQVASVVRHQGYFSCLLVDIDFFKKINDTYGHGQGDLVLEQVAETLKASVRQSDIVGRYGGEEFLILLPETNLEEAFLLAEKIRGAVEYSIKTPVQITASLGVGSCQCRGPEKSSYNTSEVVAALLEQADQALYRAKSGGRNRVEPAKKVITVNPVKSLADQVAS